MPAAIETTTTDRIMWALQDRSAGVVLTPLDFHEVADAVATGGRLEITYLDTPDSSLGVSQEGDSFVARVVFRPHTRVFHTLKNLEVVPESGGVFNFTASWTTKEKSDDRHSLGWLGELRATGVRFHVDLAGHATFVKL